MRSPFLGIPAPEPPFHGDEILNFAPRVLRPFFRLFSLTNTSTTLSPFEQLISRPTLINLPNLASTKVYLKSGPAFWISTLVPPTYGLLLAKHHTRISSIHRLFGSLLELGPGVAWSVGVFWPSMKGSVDEFPLLGASGLYAADIRGDGMQEAPPQGSFPQHQITTTSPYYPVFWFTLTDGYCY